MLTQVLIAGGIMLGLGIGLSVVLALASKKLYVFEDPRIDEVEEMLPAANCGACGTAGCRAFAEVLVNGDAVPSQCTVNTPEMTAKIAELLGVDAGYGVKKVARLACAGGSNVARTHALYQGMESCRAAALISGGGKGCAWGCLGFGDCETACPFDAIVMNEHDLPVVIEDKCTACGNCVEACPKDLFSIHPVTHRLWVACKNELAGDAAESECQVACIGCGRCAMDAAPGLITIENNLAVVDYSRNDRADISAIQRCPTGAIVWIEKDGERVKGYAARKIVRKTPLPVG